jgi:hypothetical protein
MITRNLETLWIGVLIAILVLGTVAFVTTANAQSWGRGGAYTGAAASLGYRDGKGTTKYVPFYREPCWSAAVTKCALEEARAARAAARAKAARPGAAETRSP